MKSEQNKKEMISVLTNYHSWLKLCFVEISAIISKVFYDYQISNKDKDTIQFMNYNAITLKDLNNIKDCYIKLNQEINNEAIDKEHIKLLLKKQLMNYSHIVIVNQHNKPINLKAEKYFYSFPSLQFLMKYKPRYSFNKPVCYTRSHKDSIECVCEVTNNRMATCCYDQTIKLWKRNDKVPYHSFLGHTGSVLTIIHCLFRFGNPVLLYFVLYESAPLLIRRLIHKGIIDICKIRIRVHNTCTPILQASWR